MSQGPAADVQGIYVKLAASQQLFGYWNDLRGARGAPERNDVDPGAIRGVLADTFILEFDRSAGFPMRIVGSRTSALFARELRGESFLNLWRRDDRVETCDILTSVADGAQPFLVGAVGGPSGDSSVDLEVLLLPLRQHGATHARVLGSCAPRLSPHWLGLLPIGAMALTSLRALGRSDANGGPSLRRETPPPANFRRRGHLFVYSSHA